MTEITETLIESTCHAEVLRAAGIYSQSKWKVMPKYGGITVKKAVYGEVTPQGDILINTAFLGTDTVAELVNTLRHEIAHCIVGLSRNHDKYWKAVFEGLGGVMRTDEMAGSATVRAKVKYKYQLLAILVDGTSVLLGQVHRKNKFYTTAKPGKHSHVETGKKIERYEYVLN